MLVEISVLQCSGLIQGVHFVCVSLSLLALYECDWRQMSLSCVIVSVSPGGKQQKAWSLSGSPSFLSHRSHHTTFINDKQYTHRDTHKVTGQNFYQSDDLVDST